MLCPIGLDSAVDTDLVLINVFFFHSVRVIITFSALGFQVKPIKNIANHMGHSQRAVLLYCPNMLF